MVHWDPHWFHDYRLYLQLGKISVNFLLELNFQKIYNPRPRSKFTAASPDFHVTARLSCSLKNYIYVLKVCNTMSVLSNVTALSRMHNWNKTNTIFVLSLSSLCAVFLQTLKQCFPGLAKTKFHGFPGLRNTFSRTSQDTLHSQTWLHEGKKCTYQISFNNNIFLN